MSKFAELMVMGVGIFGFGLVAWRLGFWFRGRHISGRLAKLVSLAACAAGSAIIAVAFIRYRG